MKEIYESSSCDIMCCFKRHPKQCKYYYNYKRCNFDPCAFLPVVTTNTLEFLNNENEVIMTKINDINKSIEALAANEKETEHFKDKLMEIERKNRHFYKY